MKPQLLTQLIAHFVGFLLALIILALLFLLGMGVLATILYVGNFEGIQENTSLGEIWAQVVSPNSILAFVQKAYPWGLFLWLAGGVGAGWLLAATPNKRTPNAAYLALSVLTGLGVSVAMNGASPNPSVLVANLLGTALIVPAFFVAAALSRRLPKFYEWLRDTEVDALLRRQ